MKSEIIYNAITDVRDEFVEEAKNTKLKKSRTTIARWCAVAASFLVVIGIGGYLLTNMNLLPPAPGGETGGSGHAEGSTNFMSYAGPIFPMTVLNSAEGISASRDIAYDFKDFGVLQENPDELQLHPADIRISDSYTLTNQTPNDIEVDILYPFAGTYLDLYKLRPTIYMNSSELDTTLLAGQYSGGFKGLGANDEETTHNLDVIDSWEDYRTLLSDGEYLRQTLAEFSELNQMVTVYEFTNPVADHEAAVNPTIAAWFNLDYEKTMVLGYGFNGGRFDPENDEMMQNFSVPREGYMRYGETFYLIVIGEDISNLSIKSYVDGSCDDNKEYGGATVDVTRKEAKLGYLLYTILENYMQQFYANNGYDYPHGKDVDMEMYYRSAMELLTTYGLLADGYPADRYHTGSLDDIYYETLIHQRVYYLRTQVVIPAGESVSLRVDSIKQSSFDFYAGNSENMGLYGYDMVTQLGSTLTFDNTTAKLIHSETIEIERQNFGFDLDKGITDVELDMSIERYYLEVRGVNKNE